MKPKTEKWNWEKEFDDKFTLPNEEIADFTAGTGYIPVRPRERMNIFKEPDEIKSFIRQTFKRLVEETEPVNLWGVWSDNFYSAKKFFESKGNLKTRDKLKKKWLNNFQEGYTQIFSDCKKRLLERIGKNG